MMDRNNRDDWHKPYHYKGYDGLKGRISTTELVLMLIAMLLAAGLVMALPVDLPL